MFFRSRVSQSHNRTMIIGLKPGIETGTRIHGLKTVAIHACWSFVIGLLSLVCCQWSIDSFTSALPTPGLRTPRNGRLKAELRIFKPSNIARSRERARLLRARFCIYLSLVICPLSFVGFDSESRLSKRRNSKPSNLRISLAPASGHAYFVRVSAFIGHLSLVRCHLSFVIGRFRL